MNSHEEQLAEYYQYSANHSPEEGFPRLSIGETLDLVNFVYQQMKEYIPKDEHIEIALDL